MAAILSFEIPLHEVLFPFISDDQCCYKTRKCSKPKNHKGACDKRRIFHAFWKKSQFFHLKKKQGAANKKSDELDEKDEVLDKRSQQIEILASETEKKVQLAGNSNLDA